MVSVSRHEEYINGSWWVKVSGTTAGSTYTRQEIESMVNGVSVCSDGSSRMIRQASVFSVSDTVSNVIGRIDKPRSKNRLDVIPKKWSRNKWK